MRRNNIWIVVALAALLIATVPLYTSAVDRTEADQNAAIDRLNCEVFDEDCPTPEPHTATPTPEPTATDVPATATNAPEPTATHDHGDMMLRWHAPGAHDGLPAHEHGDPVPSWILDAGYDPMYTHAANTSGENDPNHSALKHTGFKGFAGRMNGVDIYLIMHLDTTPSGHTSRFHSYQFWMRDGAGGVSHLHGWFDFGTGLNTGPQVRREGCESISVRPIMDVNDEGCGPVTFEAWYSRAGGSWIDAGFNTKAQYYTGGDPADPATWNPTGLANDVRRVELAFYTAGKPTGTFWSTQFREPVSGPNDALCGTSVTVGERTYTRICLEQYIAPTRQQISFPGNSFQREYPMVPGGFVLPN